MTQIYCSPIFILNNAGEGLTERVGEESGAAEQNVQPRKVREWDNEKSADPQQV